MHRSPPWIGRNHRGNSERVHCDNRIFFEYVFVNLVLFFGVHACDYVSDLCQYYFGSFLVLSKFLVRFLFFRVSSQFFYFMPLNHRPFATCSVLSLVDSPSTSIAFGCCSFGVNLGMKVFFISFVVCAFPLVPRLLPSISWTLR